MISSKTAHEVTFAVGTFFLLLSLYLAFFVENSYFYTSFALGSWLIFDFIDYKLTNNSILSFFFRHTHRLAFVFFFMVAFIFCFIVDYVWGIRILKTWEWINYRLIEYLRMYLIMNISFVLGIYEFYRVVKTLLKPYVKDDNLLNFRFRYGKKDIMYVILLITGIIFLISPIYVVATNTIYLSAYIMLFPFLSISFISDAITYFTGGRPILEQLIRFNRLQVASLLTTIVIAFIFTEGLNLFGREWKYLRMPFYNIQVYGVPASVLIGWIPLVVGLISLVNMVKHLGIKYNY